ncbi:AraC-type DNA-binding protein [Mesonia phycicola]|uniref:AraC-type DNA-binding protein n=1 Tax=Mesonia phycicola TaxID=579105 RepID=A0A1M6CUW8_9FLAO|nr:AraC family transcriptional regulator [Mesonia phycicola]SHI64885.1 AraC-type DNA-binding protein [Mesonia phycicola]
MAKDNFITYKPSAELLPYIAYYYFHQSNDEAYQKSFTYYPHYKNALTSYKDVDYKILKDSFAQISSEANKTLTTIYSKMYDDIGKVNLKGVFSKIGVVFQPLGIQHFIKHNYNEVFPENVNITNCFGEAYNEVLLEVFSISSNNKKASFLNQFFQNQFVGLKEDRIIDAATLIIKYEGLITVSKVASQLTIHRKTLLRLFKRHLDCSVEGYKNLVRFRFALDKIQQEKNVNLTEISTARYYDQSDFIRQFKKLTNLPPKKFMVAVSKLGNEDTYWNFKN